MSPNTVGQVAWHWLPLRRDLLLLLPLPLLLLLLLLLPTSLSCLRIPLHLLSTKATRGWLLL